MTRGWDRPGKLGLLCGFAAGAALTLAPAAHAENASIAALAQELQVQTKALAQEKALLDQAERQIARQQVQLDATRRALSELEAKSDGRPSPGEPATTATPALAANDVQGRPEPASAAPVVQTAAPEPAAVVVGEAGAPAGPVGQAPPAKGISEAVLPQGVNILTPPGHFVFDTSLAYVQASNNLLVFRGVEIVPGVEVGLIDANNTRRNQAAVIETVRYGVAPRFEIEAVVPYLYGTDRVTEAVQQQGQTNETDFLRGSGLGDVEFTGRYQITDGRDGGPIVVGSLRVKPPTGKGPFDLDYDQYGATLDLPTGSGFWGVEPSVSVLLPSDPAVLFATVGYLYNFDRTIDRTIGGALVGRVDPGGSVDLSMGFALALNPRFSFSLGFKDSYIFDTTEFLNGIPQKAESLEVGSLLLGLSYRLTDRLTIAENLEIGVTSDAPNLTLTVHIPFSL